MGVTVYVTKVVVWPTVDARFDKVKNREKQSAAMDRLETFNFQES
jgi:hypothetical protein